MARWLLLSAVLVMCACQERPPTATLGTGAGVGDASASAALMTRAPDATPSPCDALLTELRALRDGPQPCKSASDCAVWHNGSYWDGCPPEVNTAS